MRTGFLVLLFVGLILMVGNGARKNTAPTKENGKTVEYRYLPRDLDTYLREQENPSVLYNAMFSAEDVIR